MSKDWQDRGQGNSHRPQLSLFRYVALLVALLLVLGSTPLLLAQDNSGSEQTRTSVYLPAVFTQPQVANNGLTPLTPETYSAEGEDAPADAQVVASTYCSTYIKFSNQSSYTIKVYWVNSYGGETLYKTLSAGAVYWQQSYYGHVWRVRDGNGQLLKQVSVNTCSYVYVTITNSDFPQKASLGDRVWNDANRNGLQDNNEAGISGITVNLWVDSNNDGAHDTLVATQTTNANGNYLFENLDPAKKYVVKFSAGNCFKLTTPNVGTNDAIDSDAINFSTYIGTNLIALIAGQANLNADAGFYDVCAPTPTNTPVPPTPTNTPVPPTPTNTPVPPTATPTNTPAPQLGSIGDRVWNDQDRDGVQDAGEPGYVDATVQLKDCVGNVLRSQQTGANGFYTFGNLPAGCYTVSVILPGGYQFSPQDQGGNDDNDSDINPATGTTANINLGVGQNITNVDAGINQPVVNNASLGDTVWNDANRNGVLDGGEAGVSGVTVTLLSGCSGSTSLGTRTTDGNGNYSFTGLAAGQYRVQMSNLPAGFVFSPQNQGGNDATDSDVNTATGISDCITLAAGQNDPNWDAGINQPVVAGNNCIGDYIWSDLNRNGIQDNGETGVAGATINVENTGGAVIGSAVSDSTGFYQVCNLPTNTTLFAQVIPPAGYIITSENEGNDDTVDSDFSSLNGYTGAISVPAGQNNFTIDGGLVPATASVGDRVWADDATPNGIQDPGDPGLAGATVKLFSSNGNTVDTKTTDANGNYLFTNLPAGDYYICFTPPAPPPVFIAVPQDQGGDDTVDSDMSQGNNCTAIFTLTTGANLTIDGGFVDP